MFMIYSDKENITQFFDTEEMAKLHARKITKEKAIPVFFLKVLKEFEWGVIEKKIPSSSSKKNIEPQNTEELLNNYFSAEEKNIDLVNVLDVKEKISLDIAFISEDIEATKLIEGSIQEEKKDIPLYAHDPEELIKEVETENTPETLPTNQDLFLGINQLDKDIESTQKTNLIEIEASNTEESLLKRLENLTSKVDLINVLKDAPESFKVKYKDLLGESLAKLEERLQQKVLEKRMLESKKNLNLDGSKAVEESKLFQEFSQEIKQAESVQDFKIIIAQDKYKYIDKSTFHSNYKSLKERRLSELQESDCLNDLKNVKNLDDLDAVLASYPPHITSKSNIEKEIRDIEFRLNEGQSIIENVEKTETKVTTVDPKIIQFHEVETIEVIKDIVKTAFEGCHFVEDLTSVKESLKTRYPNNSQEGWFIQAYFDKAEQIKGKHKKHAEVLK